MDEPTPESTPEPTADTPSRPGAIGDFVQGLGSPLGGLRYLLAHPSLLGYIGLPVFINVLVTLGLIAVAAVYGRGWIDAILGRILPPEGWLHWLLAIPAWLMAVLLLILAAAVTFLVLSKLLAGPFNDLLSGKVEELEGVHVPGATTYAEAVLFFGKSLIEELKRLAFYAVVVALLLPLHLVPVAGSMLWAVLWGGFSLWFLGMEPYDFPMGRRNRSFRDRLGFAFSNLALIYGTGCGVTLILLVPLVNFVLLPIAVIGTTRIFLRRSGEAAGAPLRSSLAR